MNKLAEEVWNKFASDAYFNYGLLYMKESFDKYVAPYIKEPNQQSIDHQAFNDWYHTGDNAYTAESHPRCYDRFEAVWNASLKWERERKQNGL